MFQRAESCSSNSNCRRHSNSSKLMKASSTCSTSSTTNINKLLETKLKYLLKRHHGSTKNKEVRYVIDEIIPYNPTNEPTKSSLLVGDFICHTIPEFPGRIKQKQCSKKKQKKKKNQHENGNDEEQQQQDQEQQEQSPIQYTLGRLSFGVFQPHSLICTIRSVRQSIRVRLESKTGVFKTYEYPLMMDLTIHNKNGYDLPAVVCHDAVCYECPNKKNEKQTHRLKVTFKGSTLMPSKEVLNDTKLLQCWMETFNGAYSKADKERNFISRAFRGMIAWWFEISFPNDDEMEKTNNHSVHFEMKRSPRGYLDILYMSETTRITKDNRGTIVVVEPVVHPSIIEEGKAPSILKNKEKEEESIPPTPTQQTPALIKENLE